MKLLGWVCLSFMLAACKPPSPEAAPPPKPLTYTEIAQVIAEDIQQRGTAYAVMFVHPERSTACASVYAALSIETDTGEWDMVDTREITAEPTYPDHRQTISAQPIYFHLPDPGQYAITAIGCQPFGKDDQIETGLFAIFEPTPGKLNYIGDFTRNAMKHDVTLYQPNDAISDRMVDYEAEANPLTPLIIHARAQYISFINHDGEYMSIAEVIENKNLSQDYLLFKRLNTERSLATLLPFLGIFPDAGGVQFKSIDQAKSIFERKLLFAFEAIDTQTHSKALLDAGVPFKAAKSYLDLKDTLAVLSRKPVDFTITRAEIDSFNNTRKQVSQRYSAIQSRYKIDAILKPYITEDIEEKRQAWIDALPSAIYYLTVDLSGEKTIQRQRAGDKLRPYLNAKYDCLIEEYRILSSVSALDLAQKRRLILLLEQAQKAESTALDELLKDFGRESLEDNETYHTAIAKLDSTWAEIFAIQAAM